MSEYTSQHELTYSLLVQTDEWLTKSSPRFNDDEDGDDDDGDDDDGDDDDGDDDDDDDFDPWDFTECGYFATIVGDRREEMDRIRKRRWTVLLYGVTSSLLYATQWLLDPNLTAAAEDFGFNENERDRKLGGHAALAFFSAGVPASFLAGTLADSCPRSPLFASTVLIGGLAALATYWTRTFEQFLISRIFAGISAGGSMPFIYSVVGDLYDSDERARVSAVLGVCLLFGSILGTGIAGLLGPRFGWRLPFLLVPIPSIMCAILVMLTVPEPERGAREEAVLLKKKGMKKGKKRIVLGEFSRGDKLSMYAPIYQDSITSEKQIDDAANDRLLLSSSNNDETSDATEDDSEIDAQFWLETFKQSFSLLKKPTVILALVQGAPGCVPWGVVNIFLVDFLAQDRGMSIEAATITAIVFDVGDIIGLLIGGVGGDRLYEKDIRYPPFLAGSAEILGCVPLWYMINHVDGNSSKLFAWFCSILAGILEGIKSPIVKSILQNVTLPSERGRAFAFLNTFDDFGEGIGPYVVSILIIGLGGRTIAFNMALLGWVLCGVANLLIFFFVAIDEKENQEGLSQSISVYGTY